MSGDTDSMHVKTDVLMDIANQINHNPVSSLMQASAYIDWARTEGHDFGVIASAILNGPYEDGRAAVAQNIQDATAAVSSMAYGLTKVANLYQTAENINSQYQSAALDLDTVSNRPSASANDGHDTGGSVAYLADAGVGVAWAGAAGFTAAASWATVDLQLKVAQRLSSMTLVLFAAEALWIMTKPDGDHIDAVIRNWKAAAKATDECIGALGTFIAHEGQESYEMNRAWPEGQGARQAFDTWANQLYNDLVQLRSVIDHAGSVVEDAASRVKQANDSLLLSMIGLVAALIALNAMDFLFGAGVVAQGVVSAVIYGVIALFAVDIAMVLWSLFSDLKIAASSLPDFLGLTSGDNSLPDFQKLPALDSWEVYPKEAEPPPPSFGPMPTPSPTPVPPGGEPK